MYISKCFAVVVHVDQRVISTTSYNPQSNYQTSIQGGNVAIGDQSVVRSETHLESDD